MSQSPADELNLPLVETKEPTRPHQSSEHQRKSQYVESGYQEKSDSPEWDAVLAAMAAEIKVRHYSRKTLKTYGNWGTLLPALSKEQTT